MRNFIFLTVQNTGCQTACQRVLVGRPLGSVYYNRQVKNRPATAGIISAPKGRTRRSRKRLGYSDAGRLDFLLADYLDR